MSFHAFESSWTPVRVASLVAHYHAGLSAAESAELLGEATKNAVVSKRRRLGLLGLAPVAAPLGRGADGPAPQRRRISRVMVGPPPLPSEPLPDMDWPLPAGATPKSLIERGPRECAWPLGSAEEPGSSHTLYCSAPNRPRSRYCAAHAARAYRAPPPPSQREERPQ